MAFPPSSGPVDQMFRDYHGIASVIPDSPTEAVALDANFRKLLVLAGASHLEDLMSFHMSDYFQSLGVEPHEFVRRFALERRFFQWFDFDKDLPGRFFRNFGVTCEERYKELLASRPSFENSAKSFMLICSTRNLLVHQNLATATFDLTVSDIEGHFRRSIEFPDAAVRLIRNL